MNGMQQLNIGPQKPIRNKEVQAITQEGVASGLIIKRVDKVKLFMLIAILAVFVFSIFFGFIFYMDRKDPNISMFKAKIEEVKNSDEMRAYYAEQKRIKQQQTLRSMGIGKNDTVVKKNDLLQLAAERRELENQRRALEQQEIPDYSAQVAVYNAQLKAVQEKEEQLRLQAAAQAEKARQEQLLAEKLARQKAAAERQRQLEAQRAMEAQQNTTSAHFGFYKGKTQEMKPKEVSSSKDSGTQVNKLRTSSL